MMTDPKMRITMTKSGDYAMEPVYADGHGPSDMAKDSEFEPINDFINTDQPIKDRIIADMFNVLYFGTKHEDDNDCSTAELRADIMGRRPPHYVLPLLEEGLSSGSKRELVWLASISRIVQALDDHDNAMTAANMFRTAYGTIRSIKDEDKDRRTEYQQWFARHLLRGPILQGPHWPEGFMMGPTSWSNDDEVEDLSKYDEYANLMGFNGLRDSVEDLLSADTVHSLCQIDGLVFCNSWFAVRTRPDTMSLSEALDRLPTMIGRVYDPSHDEELQRFLTWESVEHYADGSSFVPVCNDGLKSDLYVHSALSIIEDRNIDVDKVLAIFDSLVSEKRTPEDAELRSMIHTGKAGGDELTLDAIHDKVEAVALRYQDMDFMNAWVWLVNLYATILMHGECDNDMLVILYECPVLNRQVLEKAVKYYHDGLPFGFIAESAMAFATELGNIKDPITITNDGNGLFQQIRKSGNELYRIYRP